MKKTSFIVAGAFAALSISCQAAWTTLSLPDTTSWENTTIGHLSDGRFIYGNSGTLVQQVAFGTNAVSAYANAPSGDYSFVTTQFLGIGGFGPGPVYSFAGGTTATSFTNISSIHQVYQAVNYDASSMILVGTAGGNSDLAYMNTGGTYVTLINNISTFSGAIARDDSGNVYVADNDDFNIYKFSSAQISSAILGTPLSIGDGMLVANLGVSGSLAVDSSTNRLYASGWQHNGIQVYDMTLGQSGSFTPGLDNSNYQVNSFTDGSNSYVGWITRSNWNGGDAVTYGYDLSSLVAIPEPSACLLLASGGLGLGFLRLRRRIG